MQLRNFPLVVEGMTLIQIEGQRIVKLFSSVKTGRYNQKPQRESCGFYSV